MFFKKLFISEARLIFMTPPRNPEAGSRRPESQEVKNIPKANQEAIKKLQDELKEAKKHDGDFDRFVGNKEIKKNYEKPLTTDLGGDLGIEVAKKLPSRVRQSNNFKKFYEFLVNEINATTAPYSNILNQNLPITAKFGPKSSLEFHNEKNKFSLKLDLKTDSPRLRLIQSQIDDLSRAKENRDEKKDAVVDKAKSGLKETKAAVNPQANFELMANQSKSQYLKKQGDIYVVDFKKNGKIDRKAEHDVQIQDLLDLSRLSGGNMYVRIYIDGKSQSGAPHKYWAYYHPSQRTFIKEGTTQRALIFHGTKISKIEWKVSPPKKAAMPKETPVERQRAPRQSEAAREKARLAKVEAKNWKNVQNNHHYIFKNDRFYVPEFIQDDSDFKKNWTRITAVLDTALSESPFNLTSPEARRKYIQDVIQDGLNSRLYAEDFFNYKINGKDLYKGGYSKFKKDWENTDKQIRDLKMDYKNPKNEKEVKIAEKRHELEAVLFGLGRIFEALSRVDYHFKNPETNKEKYAVTLVGVEKLSEEEKAKLGPLSYHSLDSLLHKNENAPKGLDIGINSDLNTELKGVISDNEIPGINLGELVADKGGLKVMFMAFGLENLIKQGCVKKLDDKHYVIVKIPKRGWQEAFGVLAKNKAKLHDNSRDNFAKWEAVRASLDQGVRSRNFILKIFKPTDSEVTQNINWWQKMMHWTGGKKEVNMEYLGNVTLNPSDIEKHVAKDRGYLDMMRRTEKRVEGTSIYEPQESEVLKLSNNYLEMGLLATFMQANPKNLEAITNQLLKDFNITDKVKLAKPLEKQENRLENLKKIYEAIALKNIDPSNLTKAHIRMIQMGYVVQRQVETAKEWNETVSESLSTHPLYREIQLKALRDGCPVYKLKEIEQKIHIAIFGLSQSMHADGVSEFKFRGAGAAASIELGEWGGQKWHTSIGAAGVDGKFMPFAEVGAAIKLGKKVSLKWSVGTTVGFTGASAAVEFPITSEWDMYLGAGVGVDWTGKVGAGAAIGAKWDKVRGERIKEQKESKDRGVEEIDKLIEGKNLTKAAELILKNPTFGEYVKAIKEKFQLPNEVVVDIYQNARTEWLNAARKDVKIPPVTGFGAGVFVGTNGISIGGYVTLKIPGTTVNYVIRHEHPQYSEFAQSRIAEERLRNQLRRSEAEGKNVVSQHVISAKSGIVYFDSRLGRGHVARPNGKSEAQSTMAVRDSEKETAISAGSTFDIVKNTFAEVDMHVEMVRDPKNPKNTLIAITPLRTESSNVELLIDPELRSKGMILDKANNRILLAASEAAGLNVTRTSYRYPFARKGAMNLEVISFKNNPNRSNLEIRDDSPQYIYKYKGEKYTMVRGEARTGLKEAESNTMTLDQYKERKASYENFGNRKLEYSMREGRSLTDKMSTAVGYKEQEQVRFDELKLGDFTDSFLKANIRRFELGIGSADTPEKEAAFKKELFGVLKSQFKDYAKKVLGNANLSLNEQELNLIYTYMLNESFVKLASKSDEVLNRRLEIRNKLFRNYMKKYVNDFANRYPEKWAELKKIDPSISPDSIADYLMLTMPQNAKQYRDFLQREQLPIGEGLKIASYTLKDKNEAFATTYGAQMPERFKDIFKLFGPTKLNIDSPNPKEKAAAKLILQVMSPLDTKDLESAEGKKKFLESELSLLLISMYDEATGISPLIEVLGRKNYEGMTKIYEAIKSGKGLDEAFAGNKQAFDQFKELVTGVRNAQLNGEPTFVFKNKYIFHVDKTEVYSGPYLKCGNGTVGARQQIGISVKQEQVAAWKAAKTDVDISVIPNERLGYKAMTLGWIHTFKQKQRPTKEEPPDRHNPPKEEVPDRHTPGKGEVPGTGETKQPPVSEGPADSI